MIDSSWVNSMENRGNFGKLFGNAWREVLQNLLNFFETRVFVLFKNNYSQNIKILKNFSQN
jgi:hypothetical protein